MSNKLLIVLLISASLLCLNFFVILPPCWRPQPGYPDVYRGVQGPLHLWRTFSTRTNSIFEHTRSQFRRSSSLVVTQLWNSRLARVGSVSFGFAGEGMAYGSERYIMTGLNRSRTGAQNASFQRPLLLTALSRMDQNKTGPNPLHLERRLPDAIIVGVKKGGTRALLEYLKLHPDIRAPGPEIHFFDRYFFRGFDWYRSQMPETLSGQKTIEKTPSYFITRAVPDRIHSMKPDMKLLIVVRNPIMRAISDYSQKLSKHKSQNGAQLLPFESFAFRPLNNHSINTIDLNLTGAKKSNPHNPLNVESSPHDTLNATLAMTPRQDLLSSNENSVVNTTWRAIKLGLYHKHVRRWLKSFSLQNMHFVSGERLITHPAEEVNLIEAFLGLKSVITEKHFYFNASKGFPCLKKSAGNDEPHCLGRTKGRPHPSISDWAIRKLKDFYEPYNQQFYDLVGRDFEW